MTLIILCLTKQVSEQVFLNGVKLVDGGHRLYCNSTTITLLKIPINGDVVEIVAYTSADLVQGYYTASSFTATTSNQVLSSNAVANKQLNML